MFLYSYPVHKISKKKVVTFSKYVICANCLCILLIKEKIVHFHVWGVTYIYNF